MAKHLREIVLTVEVPPALTDGDLAGAIEPAIHDALGAVHGTLQAHTIGDPSGPVRDALAAFVTTVEATEGVARCRQEHYHPVAEPEWTDLGDAYYRACAALGRKPRVTRVCDCGEVEDLMVLPLSDEDLARLDDEEDEESWDADFLNEDECKEVGAHRSKVDKDGFCRYCGHQ